MAPTTTSTDPATSRHVVYTVCDIGCQLRAEAGGRLVRLEEAPDLPASVGPGSPPLEG